MFIFEFPFLPRPFPLQGAILLVSLLSFAAPAPAGTFPAAGGAQEFTAADGTVTFADGSTLFSTVAGTASSTAAGVSANALRLTSITVPDTAARYLLPVIDTGREVTAFTLTFDLKLAAPAPASSAHGEGFSVNFGAIPASGAGTGETGFAMSNGLTIGWDTRDSGGGETGIYVYSNAQEAAFFPASALEDIWRISDSGTAGAEAFRTVIVNYDENGLDLTWGGQPVFTDVATPGFVPAAGDRFAFSARTSAAAVQETALDRVSAVTMSADPNVTGGPVISELLAGNQDGIEDEDFNHPDWVEIYNGQAAAVNLEGWYLTNNPANLTLWKFPSTALPGFGYTYVFASSKNRTDSLHSHTSFNLPKGGGRLLLVKPDGVTVAHDLSWPQQHDDISWGVKGAVLEAGFFEVPTPGAKNAGRLNNGVITEIPVIVDGAGQPVRNGFITANATRVIQPPVTPGAVVRYTLNGSMPVETGSASPLYTAPLIITNRSAAVRARIFAPGMVPGPPVTAASVYLGADLANYRNRGARFSSTLPVLVMDSTGFNVDAITDPNAAARSVFRPTWTQMFDPAQGAVPGVASLSDTPQFQGPAGTHVRGQSSSGFPQKPYALELWDSRDNDADFPLLGMPAQSDWVLYNPYNEESLMRNVLVYNTLRLWRGQGAAMRTRFVEVFFNQGNDPLTYSDYRGIYVLVEKIKRDGNRQNIEKLNPEVTDPALITGGYIWKKDKPPYSKTFNTTSTGGWGAQTWQFVEPDPSNTAQTNWLRTHVQAFDNALSGSNWLNPETGYRKYADTSSFADNQLFVEMFKNIDGYRISTYFSKTRAGKITALPAWDYNLAAGNANYLGGENPVGWYYKKLGAGDIPYWTKMERDPAYVLEFWDRYWQIRRGVLSTPALTAAVDGWAAELTGSDPRPVLNNSRPASAPADAAADFDTPVSRHFSKYKELGVYYWPNANNASLRKTYQDEVEYLKDWMRQRLEWMDFKPLDQLAASAVKLRPPNLHDHTTREERYSGSVSAGLQLDLTDPNARAGAEILYTVNGPDPRNADGSVNPSAQVFSGGATTKTALLPAGSTWRYFTATTVANAPAPDAATRPWQATAFNDSAWLSAPASIGYGDANVTTRLTGAGIVPTGNGNQTTYFRSTFQVENPTTVYEFLCDLNVDDGAVLYINGQETRRYNMPSAPIPITAITRAQGAIDGTTGGGDVQAENVPFTIRLDPALLTAGVNSIAVEVHQFQYGTGNTGISQATDMRFDLALSATSLSPAPAPVTLGAAGVQEVRARVKSGTAWSPLSLGSYVIGAIPAGPENLVVSEFLYDPSPPNATETAAGANSANDFEFIELLNISTSTIDLSGVTVENAITFNLDAASPAQRLLPPGGRILIVENVPAFNARWPDRSAQVAGAFVSGNLSNSGEMFTLRGAGGGIIRQFTWGTADPWPSAALRSAASPEAAYSLVLNNPWTNPDHSNGRNWRASFALNGNPGGADAAPLPANLMADADGNGQADLLDYALSATRPATLHTVEFPGENGQPALFPVFEFTRRRDADGILYTPETSADLQTWTPGGATWINTVWNNDGTATCLWKLDTPIGSGAPKFVRLKVSLP